MAMDPRTRALLEAPIGRTLLRLALPNVVVMVVQSAIGLIETYFVAKLGTDALAGITLVFPILMLVQMVSAGAMGGGILSAIARALGSGKREEANRLVWHAVAIALTLGFATTGLALVGGPFLYKLMGGSGASLAAAMTYSNIVFAGAILLWLYNSLAAIIRGAGNMILPASVTAIGAAMLLPLSPSLIFGWGFLPQLGIAGGAVAVLFFYALGSVVFVIYLWSGRDVLRPQWRPARLRWAPMADILRVGALSSLISVSTNIIIGTATGFAGRFGAAAVAGYGTGARLEYVLVPLVFGLGTPLATMVGTAIGAGQRARALRVTWTGAAIAAVLTEAIGIAAALAPQAWLGLFSSDAADERDGHAIHAYRRTVLRLFRSRPRALFRLARRRQADLAAARRRPSTDRRGRRRLARAASDAWQHRRRVRRARRCAGGLRHDERARHRARRVVRTQPQPRRSVQPAAGRDALRLAQRVCPTRAHAAISRRTSTESERGRCGDPGPQRTQS